MEPSQYQSEILESLSVLLFASWPAPWPASFCYFKNVCCTVCTFCCGVVRYVTRLNLLQLKCCLFILLHLINFTRGVQTFIYFLITGIQSFLSKAALCVSEKCHCESPVWSWISIKQMLLNSWLFTIIFYKLYSSTLQHPAGFANSFQCRMEPQTPLISLKNITLFATD